ncbi:MULTISPECIES: DUF3298 and DUF4163 domain-containing protein [Mesonia]|uniref:Uncharacterized protein n=1 Tax=Mesonia oceanica TaxID=2687242 RepID=A0AC61Y3T3_9FLAO|nr:MULTISPECIES: DUF3298 and DUF4163 domain-containing protein [Mesonia]MAN26363.1 hypothetical protein [Mesonia sp.]MBJ97499.1 hypothetical protein [Flavobacteriaceae bacterium]VVU98973.1 hypothetical protein FVB9532_00222 [Mesonia oceanica]|tara:strand:- start:4862 stop:5656 length:795 start_codon:yes stop_codon:yes gene_type:complete
MKKFFGLSLLLAVLLSACKSDPKKEEIEVSDKAETSKEKMLQLNSATIQSNQFEVCKENECPKVQLDYLVAKGENAEKINEQNESYLIEIFNSTPDSTSVLTLEEAAEKFIEDYFKFKNEFPESPATYEAEISQEELVKNDSLLTYKTKFYLFTGGAHGYGATRFLNFNPKNGERLSNADLFSDEKAFTDYAEKKFREKFKITSENINSKGFFFEDDTYKLPENIAITEDEVLLIYNPYEAASYSEGQLELILNKNEVQQFLNY